jgi:hypothetical protein
LQHNLTLLRKLVNIFFKIFFGGRGAGPLKAAPKNPQQRLTNHKTIKHHP